MKDARVLIVEDHAPLADNIAELFEDAGAKPIIFSEVDEAFRHAQQHEFELAIVDIRLPGHGNGVTLVPKLKALRPDAEVILVTGNATLDSAIAAVRHDAFAYVLKPFSPDELLRLGDRALAQVALRKEREMLARELAVSEALYRTVVEAVEAAIALIDHEGRITFCNRFAKRMSGYGGDEVRGELFAEVCGDPATKRALHECLAEALAGRSVHGAEFPLITKDGRTQVVLWTFTPLPDHLAATRAEGTFVLGVGIDLTARRELERRTAENEAMAAMGHLTTGIAHEIRNPLNAAKLQLELLERSARKLGSEGEDLRIGERATVVRSELDRLSKLLEDFLNLARTRAVEKRPFEIGPLFSEVVQLLGPLAESQGHRIEVSLEGDALMVQGDRERIKQVLLNLVGNAIEAMDATDDGRIELSAAVADHGMVEVRVTDTGPGIDPDVASKVFTPFVTTKAAGTGLGLSVVQRIIELHGGEVQLRPHPDGGTVARFTLPTG